MSPGELDNPFAGASFLHTDRVHSRPLKRIEITRWATGFRLPGFESIPETLEAMQEFARLDGKLSFVHG